MRVAGAAALTLGLTLGLSAFFAIPAAARRGDPNEQEAFSLFQAAREDVANKDFAAAVDKLTRAYELFPQPMILYRKAEALEALRRVEDAYETYKRVEVKDKAVRANVAAAMDRLEALLAKPVQVSILTGKVTGARILLDGMAVGTTPALLAVKRGDHRLQVFKEGYKPYEVKRFTAKGIDTMKLDVQLTALLGLVQVRLNQGTFTDTRITIDGKLVPILDPNARETDLMDIPVGRHQLECTRPGIPRYYRPFSVEAEEEVALVCAFPESSGARGALAWSAVGAGTASLGVGTYLLIAYFNDVDYADKHNQRLESNKQIFGPVLMGVGVAGVVTGVVLLLMDKSGDEDASSALAPSLQGDRLRWSVGPLGGGLAVGASGTF